mgnify:CR=1 FL=1
MTGGAGNRSGFEVLVALDALVVKCIGPFQHFRVLYLVFIMAIQTCFRRAIGVFGTAVAGTAGNKGGFIVHGVVVAVVAGKSVLQIRCMGLMIEENQSGIYF